MQCLISYGVGGTGGVALSPLPLLLLSVLSSSFVFPSVLLLSDGGLVVPLLLFVALSVPSEESEGFSFSAGFWTTCPGQL